MKSTKNPLKQVFIAGLVIAVIIAWGMVIFSLVWGRDYGRLEGTAEAGFVRELKNYDLLDPMKLVLEGENPELIEKRLDRLQKQAGGVEELLSALKRRRMLALADRRFIPGYAKAAKEAAASFSHSAPLAAVAAEAILLEDPLSASPLLDSYARRVSQNRFGLLELGLHILAGNLEDPSRAAGIAGITNLLSETELPESSAEDLRIDEFLLLAYKNDIRGASQKINALLDSPGAFRPASGRQTAAGQNAARQDTVRMGAEFFYDYNNPLRAGELFLRLGAERDLSRAADAMVLAGEIPGARNIWLALSSPPDNRTDNRTDSLKPGGRTGEDALSFPFAGGEAGGRIGAEVSPALSRILYNLAASSANKDEEKAWLEKIFQGQSRLQRVQGGQSAPDPAAVFGVIRYTRLLDTQDSIAILDEDSMKRNPLLDLELLRRRMETMPQLRATAEVWMLLNRHGGDEALYEWAAWYFDHQKLYAETDRVMKEANRKDMSGSWLDLQKSLGLIREGKTTEGEKLLKEAYAKSINDSGLRANANWRDNTNWRIPANLGRIQESRRAIALALEYYEAAAALVRENKAAAQLQLRISRCLAALGQTPESRRALETALELDPENINIRRELRRSDSF